MAAQAESVLPRPVRSPSRNPGRPLSRAIRMASRAIVWCGLGVKRLSANGACSVTDECAGNSPDSGPAPKLNVLFRVECHVGSWGRADQPCAPPLWTSLWSVRETRGTQNRNSPRVDHPNCVLAGLSCYNKHDLAERTSIQVIIGSRYCSVRELWHAWGLRQPASTPSHASFSGKASWAKSRPDRCRPRGVVCRSQLP